MSVAGRSTSPLAALGIARPAAIGALSIVAVALQSTLLTKVTILGVIPQVLFVVVASLAYLEGESVGVSVAFFAGFLQDLLLPQSIVGLTALVWVLVSFTIGTLRRFIPHESVWMPVLAVALASAAAEGLYALLSIVMGQQWVSIADTAKITGLVVLYNTLLTPFVFPLVRRVADRVRPERVVRI